MEGIVFQEKIGTRGSDQANGLVQIGHPMTVESLVQNGAVLFRPTRSAFAFDLVNLFMKMNCHV